MKPLFVFLIVLISFSAAAQTDNAFLEKVLMSKIDSIEGGSGRWQALYKGVPLIVITDQANNRMRIIAPITEVVKLDKDLLLDCLTANFHSALDVKYAISNELLWSVFVHPLNELTESEILSAVDQVAAAAITFGSTFSSTPLLFGGNQPQTEIKEKKKEPLYKKT